MVDEAPFRDFDAAWAERAREAPRFKAFGREFVLPKSPPVKVMLQAARAAEADNPGLQVDPEQVLDLASVLIGRDTVKTLVDEGVDLEQLSDVIRFAHEAYANRAGGDDDGPPPTEGGGSSAPSSPTGDPSKPTSPGSTDWI